MDDSFEQMRVDIGTQNRKDIAEKYRLNEDPEKLARAQLLTRECCHDAVPALRETTNAMEFARVLEEKVAARLRTDGELITEATGEDSYGERAAKAYTERSATKARDEIGIWLALRGIDTSESRRVLDLLPHVSLLSQTGELVNELLQIPGLRDQAQELFQQARDAKIREFEDFYEREK